MPRNIILPYYPELKGRARELRNNPTLAERILWREIRKKQLGYEFHRQVPIDLYIVDFYSHELMLAIEVDGASHDTDEAKIRDIERQLKIEAFGVSFLRFTDDEVIGNIDSVVEKIERGIRANTGKTSP